MALAALIRAVCQRWFIPRLAGAISFDDFHESLLPMRDVLARAQAVHEAVSAYFDQLGKLTWLCISPLVIPFAMLGVLPQCIIA